MNHIEIIVRESSPLKLWSNLVLFVSSLKYLRSSPSLCLTQFMKYSKRKLLEKSFLENNLIYEANLTLISTVREIPSHLSHL